MLLSFFLTRSGGHVPENDLGYATSTEDTLYLSSLQEDRSPCCHGIHDEHRNKTFLQCSNRNYSQNSKNCRKQQHRHLTQLTNGSNTTTISGKYNLFTFYYKVSGLAYKKYIYIC